jgi:hypothetical protein
MVRLICLVSLLALLGCADDEISEPVPVGFTAIADTSFSDLSVRLSLKVFRQGTWIQVGAVATNESTQILRYDTGGCGCPAPGVGLLSEDGGICRPPGPLCPCWTEIVEFGAGARVGAQETVQLCGVSSGPYVATAGFGYWTSQDSAWVYHSIEVSLPLAL